MPPLTSYQEKFLAQKLERALLVHSTGCFKTRTAIEWARRWGGTTLFVCPKGIKENVRRELEKWQGEADVMSKEEFKLHPPLKYNNLIIDECDHFFSTGMKSALSKSLAKYLKKYNPHLCMLSATPLRSSPWNIYVAAQFLGKKWNYRAFQDTYFFPMYMGPRLIWQPKKDEATKERMRICIAKLGDVVRREDHFDIPEQVYETIYVDEDSVQRKAKSQNVEIAPIARFTADHRAESMNTHKFETVARYAEENPAIAVICRYHEQMDALRAFLENKGHAVLEVSGRVKDRQKAIDTVNNQGGVLLIQSSTVEGFELPNIRIMVFASLDYSYRNRIQAEGRVLRMNAIAKNCYITLIAGEADEAVYNSINNKQDFDPLRYEGKRHNP